MILIPATDDTTLDEMTSALGWPYTCREKAVVPTTTLFSQRVKPDSLRAADTRDRVLEALANPHHVIVRSEPGVKGGKVIYLRPDSTELAKRGLALASNQVKINLLHRKIESNGVLDTARRLGVTLLAYLPLQSGILTGKFHDDPGLVTKMSRFRRAQFACNLDRTAPLIDGLRQIAATHSVTVGQVALAWLTTYYGDIVVAIPGASKLHHAEEAAGALRIALSQHETQSLAGLK